MARPPAFQFYAADWLRDPELAMASAASRGIWIDALAQMWFARERGQLVGKPDELTRGLRCTDAEFQKFLDEAGRLKFADVVTDHNGEITLRNRRMVREEKDRKGAVNRQARHRQNQESRPSHDEVTAPSASSSSSSSSKTGSPTEIVREKADLKPQLTLSGNGTDSKAEPPLAPEELVTAWNEFCGPLGLAQVRELSETRRKKARARLHEHPDADWWTEVFGHIRASAFLKGLGKPRNPGEKPFAASFDWLIENDTNALKIYEGRYSR